LYEFADFYSREKKILGLSLDVCMSAIQKVYQHKFFIFDIYCTFRTQKMENHTYFESFATLFQELFMQCSGSGFSKSGPGSRHFGESGSGSGSRPSLYTKPLYDNIIIEAGFEPRFELGNRNDSPILLYLHFTYILYTSHAYL
jgi:hypothetical protein